MKVKINMKSIIFMTAIAIASLLFINISFAANTGKIQVETARLREKPDTSSKILDLIAQGEEVEILDEEGSWYKVRYKRVSGYIDSKLVQIKNKTNTTNTTNTNNTEVNEQTQNNEVVNTTNETETANNETENETPENKQEDNQAQIPEETIIVENDKYKIAHKIKFKMVPLINSMELDEIEENTEVTVIEILNNWAKTKTADGKEGWIRKDKLEKIEEKVEDKVLETKATTTTPEKTSENKTESANATKTMYVNTQVANVRQKADKTSTIIKKLDANTAVKVLSTNNGWAKVDIKGTTGYIAESLLSTTKKETTSRSATTSRTSTKETEVETTSSNSSASSVISYAQQYLGSKYVYGGTTPKGFDCSGFTQYVYKHFGVALNRTAAAQYSNGQSVKELQEGDLVMFGKSGINHVGIYIGGNQFIHAANPSQGVRIDSLSSSYYKKSYVGARRIF